MTQFNSIAWVSSSCSFKVPGTFRKSPFYRETQVAIVKALKKGDGGRCSFKEISAWNQEGLQRFTHHTLKRHSWEFWVLFCTWKFLQNWYHIGDKAALELTASENTKVGDAALHNLDTEQIHNKSLQTIWCNMVVIHTSLMWGRPRFSFSALSLASHGNLGKLLHLYEPVFSSVKKRWLHFHHRDVERIKLSSRWRDTGLVAGRWQWK